MARRIAAIVSAALLATACADAPDLPPEAEQPEQRDAEIGFEVTEVVAGLEHAWDVGFLPGGEVLISERPARFTLLSAAEPGAQRSQVDADLSDVFVSGEGGLLGMVVHPDFAESRLFTTCQTHQRDGEPVDVRLVTWRLAEDNSSAQRVRDLVTGMPIHPSGRHSGCRPTATEDGVLYVGTGDAAFAHTPQDRQGLGGKVLRIDSETGDGLPDNPFADADDANERRILSYGHRNVQGVALRPGTDQVFIAEHGPTGQDQVNVIESGGNYGWDPSQDGTVDSYDESVPMTDLERFPDAVPPVWDTGRSTEAPSGAAFLSGEQWGEFDGALAIAALRGSKLILLTLEGDELTARTDPPELDGTYDRLRAARTGPDGALYVTTSNGSDDRLLKIEPTGAGS